MQKRLKAIGCLWFDLAILLAGSVSAGNLVRWPSEIVDSAGWSEEEMAILYALAARGTVVLAEFSSTSTNASTIAKQILEKVPGNNDSNVSYSQDRYVFHVKRTDGLTVLCMAEENAGSTSPLPFPLFAFALYVFDFVLVTSEINLELILRQFRSLVTLDLWEHSMKSSFWYWFPKPVADFCESVRSSS